MAPSLRTHPSFVRPPTRDRPSTRDHTIEHSLVIPSRTSSLHSRITQPIQGSLVGKPSQRSPKTLTHAYMVCGLGKEPAQWVKAPAPQQGKITHMKGAVGHYWLPEILGSSPRIDQDNEMAKSLHSAMRVGPTDLRLGVVADEALGLLSPRRRDLHRPQPAALHTPRLRPPAGLLPHPVRHRAARMVQGRRQAG